MLDIFTAYKEIWKDTLKYNGRMSRRKYWILMGILLVVVFIIPTTLDEVFNIESKNIDNLAALFLVVHVPTTISASIRRLHDINKSGYFYILWVLIPIIGIFQGIMPGTQGINRFGEPDIL